jgi:anti-sigma B factor antagonist
MRCEVRQEADHAVVELAGEVDLSTSPRARQAILGSLAAGRPVAVDLGGVSYIDSSGVASLVEGYQAARSQGTRFALVGVSDAARGVLELARLDKVFPIFTTVPEFLAHEA